MGLGKPNEKTLMRLGNTTVRYNNVSSNAGYFNSNVVVGNTVLYRNKIITDAMNVKVLYVSTSETIGDPEANVYMDRYGLQIYDNPSGVLVQNSKMTSTDLWIKNIHSNGTIEANNVIPMEESFEDLNISEEETKQITYKLSDAGRLFQNIDPLTLNRVAASDVILTQIKTFNNTKVRAGQAIKNTAQHTRELIRWIEDKHNKEILAAKKDETKKKRIAEKNEVMRFFRSYAGELQKIFDIQNDIVVAKSMVIRKLQQLKQVTNTFLQTENGFKVTNPEGFVAVDKLKGNAVKLVDRLEFSLANFSAKKAWDK